MSIKHEPPAHTTSSVRSNLSPGQEDERALQTVPAGKEGLQDVVFGSIAGTVGKVVEYPFDTVKVRLQSQPDHLPLRYKGPLDCFRQSLQADGVRSLYRGVSAPLFGAAAETACLFWSYGIAQDILRSLLTHPENGNGSRVLPLSALVTAGAMAGSVTSVVLTPIELVKCRMQAPLSSASLSGFASKPISPMAVISEVFRREGLKGFWRGQMGTFLRETGGTAAWFGSYEASTAYLKFRLVESSSSKNVTEASQPAHTSLEDIELPISHQMLAGATAGVAYNFLFFPADTIKSKMQTGELSSVRLTFLDVGRELYRTHGLKGLYRGCGITVARSAPSSALIFTIVENLKKTFA